MLAGYIYLDDKVQEHGIEMLPETVFKNCHANSAEWREKSEKWTSMISYSAQ